MEWKTITQYFVLEPSSSYIFQWNCKNCGNIEKHKSCCPAKAVDFPPQDFVFVILKPDCIKNHNLTKTVLKKIKEAHFKILIEKNISKPKLEQAMQHYAGLKARNLDAYSRNTKSLSSGPLRVLIVEGDTVKFKQLVGPTDPTEAPKGTIRALSEDSIAKATKEKRGLKNIIHSSDNTKEAVKEANIWLG